LFPPAAPREPAPYLVRGARVELVAEGGDLGAAVGRVGALLFRLPKNLNPARAGGRDGDEVERAEQVVGDGDHAAAWEPGDAGCGAVDEVSGGDEFLLRLAFEGCAFCPGGGHEITGDAGARRRAVAGRG